MRKALRLFLLYFRRVFPHRWLLAISFISDMTLSIITMLPPLFSVAIFDFAYPNRDLLIFNFFVFAGITIYFINIFLSASIDYINTYTDRQIEYELSKELFLKIEHLPLRFHDNTKIGDLTIRLTDDVYQIVNLITGFIPVFVVNLAKLAFFLFISFRMNSTIALLALCSIPVYIIETKFFSDKLEDIQSESQKVEGNIMDCIRERVSNIRTIKAFSQENQEIEVFGNRIVERFWVSLKERIVSIISAFANSVTLKVWSAFIGWYLGYAVINGYLSIGEIVALTMYLPMLAEPIAELSNLYSGAKICMVSMRRVDEVFNMPEDSLEDKETIELGDSRGEIRFEDVSFGYESESLALAKINLDIPENSSVAFVGSSGSGKTTLINLLMRFYPLGKGAIYIDGKNISEIKLGSLRKTIGAVFQEISLFEGTIRDNISYGVKYSKEEDIINAARMAQAHDFISLLPGGYDFRVKAQGVNLSAGQRQRISLARVFLYNPRIIVLDEATSAIDPESEFMIQETIYNFMGTKTLFIIAHRLSTIKRVDRIVVLDKGRITEEGVFDELLKRKGPFFKLYNYQFGGFETFKEHLDIEFQRFVRYKEDLSLVMAEVDDFESCIKKCPFEEILSFMNELNLYIRKNLRTMDFSTVFQENRILIALPETDSEEAKNFCNRISGLLKQERIQIGGETIPVTLTIGIASCKETDTQYTEELIRKAAAALITARDSGMKIGVYK